MNVVNKGLHIGILYLRMNIYTYIALHFLQLMNQTCSNDGVQFITLLSKGSLIMFLLNLLAILYIKTKEKHNLTDNILLSFINLCWILIIFQKSYSMTNFNPYECSSVVMVQQISFYFHTTTQIWVIFEFCSNQTIIRITSLPINAISFYLIYVNQQQSYLDENAYLLLIFAIIWTIVLGIPYNIFMTLSKKIKTPYIFLTVLAILIQFPLLYIIYQNGFYQNSLSQESQIGHYALNMHFFLFFFQLIQSLIYFAYYSKFENEITNLEVNNRQTEMNTTKSTNQLSQTIKITSKK